MRAGKKTICCYTAFVLFIISFLGLWAVSVSSFLLLQPIVESTYYLSAAANGFGPEKKAARINKPKKLEKGSKKVKGTTYNKAEQAKALEDLAAASAKTVLGRAVALSNNSELLSSREDALFWEMIPSLIVSKFPSASDTDLKRVADFLMHTLNPTLPKDDNEPPNEWRPTQELHAYMPGVGLPRVPFLDTSKLALCRLLEENYETILQEYRALVEDGKEDRFQSVTSLNYEAGWKTLVLFYNGHRIPKFPYHLCPVTTRILETVPIGGRIAGFNRQAPNSGIPLHTDGNNMWLTCQMGIQIPQGDDKAYIRVGPETRYWSNGKCLLYDTTFVHETRNDSLEEERIVLHLDFFNTLSMSDLEIKVMQYIYEIREKFLKAEGSTKVEAQIL